jgi:Flp pilus assembly pilin Flp
MLADSKFLFEGFGVTMKSAIRKFWNDEAGFVISVELILIATILVIGLVTGWAMLRDAVLAELADTAAAIGTTNQSFAYSGVTYGGGTGAGAASSAGGNFTDAADAWDVGAATQGIGLASPTTGLAVIAVTADQSAAAE